MGVPVVAGPGDGELWRRAADGDQGAFTALFERHAQAVWNHAYRLTGSWSAAEDLTSNAFLIAWRKRAEVTLGRDSALPWPNPITPTAWPPSSTTKRCCAR